MLHVAIAWVGLVLCLATCGGLQLKGPMRASLELSAIRLRILGTKNAYTSLRTGDVVAYTLTTPIKGKIKRLGVLSKEETITPLCIDDDGRFCISDPSAEALDANVMNAEERLLRFISAERKGSLYLIEEYIGEEIYLPSLAEAKLQEDLRNTNVVNDHLITPDFARSRLREVIHTANAPLIDGPYSQAVRINGLVFVSGCLGVDPSSSTLVGSQIEEQTKQSMINVGSILIASGTSWSRAVKVTVHIADISDYGRFNAVYREVLEKTGCLQFPARTIVQVGALALGAKVSIEVVATCD